MGTGSTTMRIPAVDSMRVFAILAVIIIHTCPFRDIPLEKQSHIYNTLGIVLNQLARFGVPFFFTVAGFFWGQKIRGGAPVFDVTKQLLKRLLWVLAFWSFVYLLPYNVAAVFQYGVLGPLKVWYWNLLRLASDPLIILFESTIPHLWFLIALIWSASIAAVFTSASRVRTLVIVAAALYVFGILALAYVETPIGIRIPFYTLTGPFFGTLFFVTGYLLSAHTPRAEWLVPGIVLAVLGFGLHFTEVFTLLRIWEMRPSHHYLFGTWFIGVGVTLIALANPRVLRSQKLAKAGQLTLGVYAVHIVFVEWAWQIIDWVSSPLWEIGRVVLIYALSFAIVSRMAKMPTLARFVK